MIPLKLTLVNYGPFRGEHVIELSPLVYSVVARDIDDSERSNWIGKSWFLSSFRFALFGRHPGRTKDKLITDGESEGSVRLDLEGDVSIVRSKRRGSGEQLILRRKETAEAKQERAQELIDELVGFNRQDFDASCWVRQKGANEIVVADPAVRTNTVTGWMDLGKIQEAAEAESGRLMNAVEIDRNHAARLEHLSELIGSVGDVDALTRQIGKLEIDVVADEKRLKALYADLERATETEKLKQAEFQLEQIVADGKSLKREMQAEVAGGEDLEQRVSLIEARISEAAIANREAAMEAERISKLVVGDGFDGICPVIRERCPSAKQIEERARKMDAAHKEAKSIAIRKAELYRTTMIEKTKFGELLAARRANAGRLAALREQARRLVEIINRLKEKTGDERVDAETLRIEASRLQAKIGISKGEISAVGKQLDSIDNWVNEKAEIEKKRVELASRIRTHREAAIVLGRNGAQREIAKDNLADIEAGANTLLGSAGIDLSVRASWGREGTGLATHCQSCGQPFSSSAREKTCQTCGAGRGPKIVEKLELELSSDSDGAAEDIAGLAMQLSAAAWLRTRRQAAWSTVFIDEPFASCDARIGEQLASQLRIMLGGAYSFRQAFVVSHSAILTESMPGRIEIIRGRDGSLKIEVR